MTEVNITNSRFDIFSPSNLKVNNSGSLTFQPTSVVFDAPQDSFMNSNSVTATSSLNQQLALMMAQCLQSMRSVPVVNQFVPQATPQYSDTFALQSSLNTSTPKTWSPMDYVRNYMAGNTFPAPPSGTNLSKGTIKVSKNVEKYDSIIQQKAQKYGLDPNFVKCVIQQESGGNAKAESHCGAMGLMQLMPKTAEGLGCSDPWDPAQNIDAGCKYLAKMMKKYDGDMKLTLASYNAGPGNVRKYGGVPPFAETQNYVAKIINNYQGLS